MYHKRFFRKRLLLARTLAAIYSREGEKARSLTYVWKTYGADLLCMGSDSFSKHCKQAAAIGDDENIPLQVEAAIRSLERNREMAEKYLRGEIEIWDIPHTGAYDDLIETIRDRKRKALETHAKARREESVKAETREPVGQE